MRIQFLFFGLLLFIGCTKKDTDSTVIIPPSTNDIVLVTNSAVPGEIVIAQANFRPAKDTATILVGGKKTFAMVVESNQVVFFMPELTAGSNAQIQFQNMGVNKTLSIAVGNYTAITQPDQVFDNAMLEQNEIITYLNAYKDDPIIQVEPGYMDAILYIKQNIALKFAALTVEEKIQVAYVFRSNRRDPLSYKMEPLNPLFYNRTEAVQPDAEDIAWVRSGLVLTLAAIGLTEFGIGIAAVGAGLFSAPAGVYGIFIGATAVVAGGWLILEGIEDFVKAAGEFKGLYKGVSKAIGINVGATLVFLKDIGQSVTFKGNFRSVIQSDATSSNALMKRMFSAQQKVKEAHAKMVEGYAKIKLFFLGNPPVIPSDNLEFGTQSFSKEIAMQGEKLTVTNISNAAINVTVVKEDAALNIKTTSSSITQETAFNFDVTYINPLTGTVITKTIGSIYKPVPDSIDFYKSLIPGSWSQVWDYDFMNNGVFSFYQEDFFMLDIGGTGTWTGTRSYTGVVSSSSVPVNWSVSKTQQNTYIMSLRSHSGRITPTQLSYNTTPASVWKTLTKKN